MVDEECCGGGQDVDGYADDDECFAAEYVGEDAEGELHDGKAEHEHEDHVLYAVFLFGRQGKGAGEFGKGGQDGIDGQGG